MKMRNIAVLPSLVTLGNAVSGFVAIGLIVKAPHVGETANLTPFVTAGYLIFLAMIFDALDGRVARLARVTSDFGGQLDSLSDAISFGAAPAILAYRLFCDSVPDQGLQRLTLVLGAVYFGCTILRLARFNVENVHDEEAHLSFRGLPSPAAAGALVSVVILLLALWHDQEYAWLPRYLIWSLPVVMLGLGLLMVSRVRYIHLVNQLIRGRRPLSYVVQIIIAVALVFLLQEKALAALLVGYVVSGPVIYVYRKLAHVGRTSEEAPAESSDDPAARR